MIGSLLMIRLGAWACSILLCAILYDPPIARGGGGGGGELPRV